MDRDDIAEDMDITRNLYDAITASESPVEAVAHVCAAIHMLEALVRGYDLEVVTPLEG